MLVLKSKALQLFIDYNNRYVLAVNMVRGGEEVGRHHEEDTQEEEQASPCTDTVPGGHYTNKLLLAALQNLPGAGLQLAATALQSLRLLGDLPSASPAQVKDARVEGEGEGGSGSGSDCDSDNDNDEGSVDSGFGEHDMKHELPSLSSQPQPESREKSEPAPLLVASTAMLSSAACNVWSAACFVWELCKSDYWIFIIAFTLLLLSKHGMIPDS